MKREDAIGIIMRTSGYRDVVVTTTGLISREVFERYDSSRNFYMPGSMGLASSVGCGLALARPEVKIIVIDGDASLLMNLGALATIGHLRPVNLLHIVLDNRAYGSCSEEPSMSSTAHLDRLARTAGYAWVKNVSRPDQLVRAMLSTNPGPRFVLCRIELGGRRDFLRPLQLETFKRRFLNHLGPSGGTPT